MFSQMYDFVGKAVYTMPAFLASTKYQNPTNYMDSPFQYGHQTRLGFWEYLKEDPERMKLFSSGMQSLATVGSGMRSSGAYPFEEELGREEVKETDVLVVDVGGGRGQALEAIKASWPASKGRMVLQDVRDVIDDAEASELPGFIEPMAASFRERQPVEGQYTGLPVRSCFNFSPSRSYLLGGHQGAWLSDHSRSSNIPLPAYFPRLV